MTEPLDLEGIRKRAEAATPGPWEWSRDYELFSHFDGSLRKHWGLHNPDIPGCVTNAWLVTATYEPANFDGTPLDATPDFQFIAHARSDIPLLIAEVERLREELKQLRESMASWPPVSGGSLDG